MFEYYMNKKIWMKNAQVYEKMKKWPGEWKKKWMRLKPGYDWTAPVEK
jgi:hypothetical protein